MTHRSSPSWLPSPCPHWCSGDHNEDDHLEDRYHRTVTSHVPAIVMLEERIPVHSSLHAAELIVHGGQHVDSHTCWVSIEAAEHPRPRLVMSLESARSVARALQDQLDQLSV